MNVKNLRKGSILLIIAALSLALLLSGCAQGQAGSWLPDIEAADIKEITMHRTRNPDMTDISYIFGKEEKKAIMLEYLRGFPHEEKVKAEPPEDATSMTMQMREGEAFEFRFDEYGVYVDGIAYTSSEPYLGHLRRYANPAGGYELLEMTSMETTPFSEYFDTDISELEEVRVHNGNQWVCIDDAESMSKVLEYIGEFGFVYRFPDPDNNSRSGCLSAGTTQLVGKNGETKWMYFSDTMVMYDGICYYGPTYFDNMVESLISRISVDRSLIDLNSITIEDMFEDRDLVVRGTYLGETEKQIYAVAGMPQTFGEIAVSEVYKGSCDDTITIYFWGGSSPVSEILREEREAGMETADPDAPEVRHQVRVLDSNLIADLVEGREYLLFLTETEHGYSAGIKYSIREINEEGLVYNPETKEYEIVDFVN